MANLIIQENGKARTTPAVHGEEITLQAPCDCSAVNGVQIAGSVYPFYDAAGNVLAMGTGLFTTGNLIRVLIDTVNFRAIIMNHAITPAVITSGTLAGQVVANNSGQDYATSLLRNSKLVSAETTPTVNGEIYWIYG